MGGGKHWPGWAVALLVLVCLAAAGGIGYGLYEVYRHMRHESAASEAGDAVLAAAGIGSSTGGGQAGSVPVPMSPAAARLQEVRLAAKAPAPSTDFPIHALFTWVQGDDEAWRASKAETYQRLYGKPYQETPRDPMRAAAADGKDELYYSVHLITKFCPWLDRVWILTARGHRPPWLQLGSGDGAQAASARVNGIRVTVVHHDRVFDTTCVQGPTFNSYAIEGQIPHIAHLAEHFIMCNDDFFVGQPMARTDFFTATGLPAVHLRNADAQIKALPTMWGQALRNMQAHCRRTASGPGHLPEHVAAPLRKSVLRAIVQALRPEVCASGPFRSNKDFPSWYIALNAAPSVPRPARVTAKYFATGPAFAAFIDAGNKLPHLFCINQEFTEDAREILERVLTA